ncbi:MAG TPA: aminotransferase class I/II-fold pyridoxal phosphate-dependent enzyme [Candidatus Thermoplasmatota archaeon]
MQFEAFDHLEWVGMHADRAKNAAIATSNVVDFPLHSIPLDLKGIDLHVPNLDGHPEVLAELARIYGVEPAQVIETTGASEANFCAFAALASPGDRVVVEDPTYESLQLIPRSLGMQVVKVERDPRMGFALDLETLKQATTRGTRLVALTNLHNPSGVAIPRATLKGALEVAADAGAVLYVDEVFRDFGDAVPSVADLEGPGVAAGSMSKLYGLGWTRIGWTVSHDLATADRIRRARRLISAAGSTLGGAVAAWALREQARFIARAKAIVGENRVALTEWAESLPGVQLTMPDGGPIAFPRVPLPRGTTGRSLAESLLASTGVLTVPGELFGRPGHFRVGCGSDPAKTREALGALRRALGAGAP